MQYGDGVDTYYVIAVPDGNLTTSDGQVLAYNATNDEFEFVASGGSVTYNSIGDPTVDSAINFAAFTNIWTSTLDTGSVLKIDNTDADLAGDTVLLELEFTDDADINGLFIQANDNDGDLRFQVGLDGGIVSNGVVNFGAATSVEIANGTAPTVDAAGEIAVDTTDDQLIYYGGAARVLSYKQTKSVVLESPVDADSIVLWKTLDPITITDIECIVDPADSAESVVIDLHEADATGDTGVTVDATITCDNDGAADDGTFTNGAIDANDWLLLDIGTVTGTVTQVSVTIYYTVDAE